MHISMGLEDLQMHSTHKMVYVAVITIGTRV